MRPRAASDGFGPHLSSISLVPDRPEPLVEWLESSLNDIAGRDPLGLNTISTDRVLPQLLPGILQLSERARYFSIYPWMLSQFGQRRHPATTEEFDRFIRRHEFELCLAMQLCNYRVQDEERAASLAELDSAVAEIAAGLASVALSVTGWHAEICGWRPTLVRGVDLGVILPAGAQRPRRSPPRQRRNGQEDNRRRPDEPAQLDRRAHLVQTLSDRTGAPIHQARAL